MRAHSRMTLQARTAQQYAVRSIKQQPLFLKISGFELCW